MASEPILVRPVWMALCPGGQLQQPGLRSPWHGVRTKPREERGVWGAGRGQAPGTGHSGGVTG